VVAPQQSKHSKVKKVDKPLGRETEAFFDEVMKRKRQLPPGGPSMADPHSLADLNRDGRCNRADLRLFRRVAGKCAKPGAAALVTWADLDGDGCVTREDRRSFLQLWKGCNAKEAKSDSP
jgi:hypothetical protein